jgi:membrane protein DedA with SNARE-associated domain
MTLYLSSIITTHGYLAIFFIILLQEIGAPFPIPNVFVLLFTGVLIFMGTLKFGFVLLTVILADFIASMLLYAIFYFSGNYLFESKLKWLPIPVKTINYLKKRIVENGQSAIYIGRLLPFLRGYVSVIAGLLQIKRVVYIPIALITTSIWSLVIVTTGIVLGPVWERLSANITNINQIMFVISILIVMAVIIQSIIKPIIKKQNNESTFSI